MPIDSFQSTTPIYSVRKGIFLFLLLVLISQFSFAVGSEPSAKTELKMAPQWSLFDAEGNEVKSSDFKGKPLIIHFWATWCPYCKKLQPGLDKLYKKYHDQGLQMIAISLREDEGAKPQDELIARGMSFKTLINGDKVAMEKFFARGTPTTFFINAQGQVVVATRLSDPDDPRLEQVVKSILVN